jgi:hypothetical protein
MSAVSKALGPRIVGRKENKDIIGYARLKSALPNSISARARRSAKRGAEHYKARARFLAVCREADERCRR